MGVTCRSDRRALHIHFNSHPRVGGDLARLRGHAAGAISIRTPAWGGDFAADGADLRGFISIRTLAWGVTRLVANRVSSTVFQFAPPRGG